MSEPVRTFSSWKLFAMTWLGYVIAGAVYAVYFTVFAFKPNGFVGPDLVFVASILGAAVTGILYLPLPLLMSFALNGDIRGTSKSLWVRSLILGTLICALINGWPKDPEGTNESHVVRIIFVIFAVFVLPLFMFARRADRNLLYEDAQPYTKDEDDGAQPAASCDRSKTRST